MKKFIIEHLEPRLYKWCKYEYGHISEIVGKRNLIFTNIKRKSKDLNKLGKIYYQSVKDLDFNNACLLDPESKQTLTPKIAKNYDYFIFGGILGDYPPKKRTGKELAKFLPNIPGFNLGKKQMATDNAIYVTKKIIEGVRLDEFRFQNTITIRINNIESTDLPYNYVLVDDKPLISTKVIDYLKRKKGF